jgi:hypothetical protein
MTIGALSSDFQSYCANINTLGFLDYTIRYYY